MKYFLLITTLFYLGACSNQSKKSRPHAIEIEADSIYDAYTSADSSKSFLLDLHFLKFKSNNPSIADSLNNFVMMQLMSDSVPVNTSPAIFYQKYAKAFKQEFMELIQDTSLLFVGYENTLDITLAYQTDKRIGLVSNAYLFTAGAHGIGSTYFANINLETGKKLSIADCFQHPEAMRRKAEIAFRNNIGIETNASLNEAGYWFDNDQFKLTENFLIKDSIVEFFYNVYEIAPYSNGPTSIEIPISPNDLK
jgi:hypothetical protein